MLRKALFPQLSLEKLTGYLLRGWIFAATGFLSGITQALCTCSTSCAEGGPCGVTSGGEKGLAHDPLPGVPKDEGHKEERLMFFLLEIQTQTLVRGCVLHEPVLTLMMVLFSPRAVQYGNC